MQVKDEIKGDIRKHFSHIGSKNIKCQDTQNYHKITFIYIRMAISKQNNDLVKTLEPLCTVSGSYKEHNGSFWGGGRIQYII